jgi:hypothetical protein
MSTMAPSPQALVEAMVRIPAWALTNLSFPLQVARRDLARDLARLGRGRLRSVLIETSLPR